MITVVLHDIDDKPVGRANLPSGSLVPAVVLWNDRAFTFVKQSIAGYTYRQVSAVEIPAEELRKAPGLI